MLFLLSILLSACGAVPKPQNWPGLAVSSGSVYAISGSPQSVYVLDAETGSQKATFSPMTERTGLVYWSAVAEGDGLAFVGFSDPATKTYRLYAFNPETGQEQGYAEAQDMILPAPIYADGTVYFGSSDGRVYAVDAESRQSKAGGWPFQTEEAIWGSPLVADGRVYVASMDHHVYCLDAESGAEIWRIEVGGAMAAQPTLDAENGVLYVGAFDGKVHAIDVASDAPAFVEGFDFQADDWIWSEVLLSDGQLFVTSLDGKLYALDPSSGAVIPPYPYDTGEAGLEGDRIRAAPILAGELVVVATESGRVVGVKDATRQWVWPTGGVPEVGILATPVVSGGIVYVILTDSGVVQALNAADGGQKWRFSPPEAQ